MTAQAADSVYKKLEKVGILRTDKPIDNSVIAQVSGTQYRIISEIPNSAVTLTVTQLLEILSLINSLNENIDEHGKMIVQQVINQLTNNAVTLDTGLAVAPNVDELERYRGRYVAIENNRVVASGTNSVEALAEARKDNPKRKVLLKLVSDSDIGL